MTSLSPVLAMLCHDADRDRPVVFNLMGVVDSTLGRAYSTRAWPLLEAQELVVAGMDLKTDVPPERGSP